MQLNNDMAFSYFAKVQNSLEKEHVGNFERTSLLLVEHQDEESINPWMLKRSHFIFKQV